MESEMTWKDGVVCKRTSYNGSLGDCGGSNQMGSLSSSGSSIESSLEVGLSFSDIFSVNDRFWCSFRYDDLWEGTVVGDGSVEGSLEISLGSSNF